MSIPLIKGLSELADSYDALLCDVWGVLHNGETAYAGVPEALANFRAKGGHVLLLSNAPRPSDALPVMFEQMGIPHDVYDGILTSGDATKTYLASHECGTRCYLIGMERHLTLFEGTGVARVSEDEAEFILAASLFDAETEGPEDYRAQLEALAARKLPLVCANPDIVVESGDRHIYCPGALARLYEELDGKVIYLGKPHLPIYAMARTKLAALAGRQIPDARILAIGDGILTDMKGADAAGIDALFITGGIAAADCGDHPENPDPVRVADVCAKAKIHPVAAMARLIW